MEDSAISQALEVLTLANVWELAPDNSEAPRRDGLRHSPFRKDTKPSFSIFGDLKRYKDQASGDKAGGVWTFVQACRPDWAKVDIARYLVERAGLEWKEPGSGSGSGRNSSIWKWRNEQAKKRREKVRRIYDEHNRLPARPQELVEWPAVVENHYMFDHGTDDRRLVGLAKRRGWPVEWVEALYDWRAISWPQLPWSNKRYPALIVQHPDFCPIGYHQRIWTSENGLSWLYVPYRPRGVCNDFTRELDAYARARESGRLVVPLPFVLGSLEAGLWIITEGQWDAITIYGLLGGFEDQFELDIAVFGLRGAEAGPGVFLQYYQDRVRRQKPHIWLMPDNDAAGASWDGRGQVTNFSRPVARTFVEQLLVLVGQERSVPVSRVPERFGKDFNDYYRKAKPSRESLLSQLERHFPQWIQAQAI